MSIGVGDKFFEVIFKYMVEDGIQDILMYEFCNGKIVVFFVVFGVFILICQDVYLLIYVDNVDQFKVVGVDMVVCVVVNDVFVMNEWC